MTDHDFDSRAFISHFSDLQENTGFYFLVPEFLSLSLFFFF